MESPLSTPVVVESSDRARAGIPFVPWPAIAAALLGTQAVLSLLLAEGPRLTAYNNIPYLIALILAAGLAARNAVRSNQSVRLFWIFVAAGLGLRALNPLGWIVSVLVAGKDYPDIATFSFPRFVQIVLLIAAVAARPHLRGASVRPYRTTLNFLLLLFFWVFLYAFLMLPFLRAPLGVLELRFTEFYFAENLVLLVALGFLASRRRGPWKLIYAHLLGASVLYAIASLGVNLVLARQGFSPGWLDIPYTAAGCWFVWVGVLGWQLGPELAQTVELEAGDERQVSIAAALAVVSIPLIGLMELFRADEPSTLRVARLGIVFASVALISAVVTIQNHLVNRHLASDAGLAQYLLRLAMQAGKAVVWDVDFKTGRANWSGDLPALFGVEAVTISGTGDEFHQYVHPDDRTRVADTMEHAQQSKQPYTTEFRIVRRDGAVRFVSARGKFYFSSNGSPFRMVGMAVDITERKAAEEALKKSEEKFSKAFRESPLALTLTSVKDHRYIEVNETFERLTGWSRDEVMGRTPFDLGIWVDPDQRIALVQRLSTEGTVRNLEFRYRTKSGEQGTALGSAELIEVNGELCALSVIADITEIKRAEEALREGEERFRLVANAAPVLIWTSGTDKLCDYFNQPWLEFTGRPLEAELGNGWAEGVHPEDLARCLDSYTKAFDRREPFEMEYRLRRHDGEYRWINDHGVPRFQRNGTFAGYIGSCHDITERKRAEEALSTVSRRLIEAHEEERTWIARELHDDINQRVALLGITLEELGRGSTRAPKETRRRLGEAHEQVAQLGREIQALSHRLHSSKLEYLGFAVAARGFCRELSERAKVKIDFDCAELPQDLPPEISLCLFRVLQEALQNAAKHSGSDYFQVSVSGPPGEIQMVVRDSGIGFDPEQAITGRGIGLSSMNERLKIVSGELSIESQSGRGTVVRASVPLHARAKAASATT